MNLLLAATTSSVHETEKLVSFTLIELLAILIAARLAAKVARWLGQSRVVGEIVGGLIMGPSLFGRLFPQQFDFVFHSISPMPMVILSQIGLALLMFQIGLEFDFTHLKEKQNRNAMVSVSAAGVILPFTLGWFIGGWSHESPAPGINPLGYRLFMAVALSITAIPILGRIMMELGITKTRIGAIAITAAALDDVTGWTLLAVVSALTTAEFSAATFATKLGLLVAYLAICLFVVRPVLRRIVDKLMGTNEHLPHDLMALMIGLTFLSGLVTYSPGGFVIFGGFVMGVLLHDHHRFVEAWKKRSRTLSPCFSCQSFLPLPGYARTCLGWTHRHCGAGVWSSSARRCSASSSAAAQQRASAD